MVAICNPSIIQHHDGTVEPFSKFHRTFGLTNDLFDSTQLIPPGLRWISPDYPYKDELVFSFLFEAPPHVKQMNFQGTSISVVVPWILYFVTAGLHQSKYTVLDCRVFVSASQIFSSQSIVHPAMIYGTDELGRFPDLVFQDQAEPLSFQDSNARPPFHFYISELKKCLAHAYTIDPDTEIFKAFYLDNPHLFDSTLCLPDNLGSVSLENSLMMNFQSGPFLEVQSLIYDLDMFNYRSAAPFYFSS